MTMMNLIMDAAVVPYHADDKARLLERARILLSGVAEQLIRAEAFEPEATALVDEIDSLLPRVRRLVDKYDPPEHPLAS